MNAGGVPNTCKSNEIFFFLYVHVTMKKIAVADG